MSKLKHSICFGVLVLVTTGCLQTRVTEPSRTAVEQLLLSRAADKALAAIDFSAVAGKKVYVEDKYLETIVDRGYLLGLIRDHASRAGGLLEGDVAQAEMILEPRSGALSIDSANALLGVPEVPLPIPFVGTLESPEMPLFKSIKQYSVAKIALLGYDAKTKAHIFSAESPDGDSFHHYYTFFGYINWTNTDLPEKRGR